jgi:DNA-binding response OmpR family regulator
MVEASASRVLLVEDEPALSSLMEKFLSRLGFPVQPAGTAREALASFETEAYRAAIIDLTLPDMPGEVLAEELWRRDRRLAVLFVSGRPTEITPGRPARFLQKPFLPAALSAELLALLDQIGVEDLPRR